MLFNSYIFLFLFLPLALAGWYLLNRFRQYKLAQGYLIGMSLWFYAYYNVSFLWVITDTAAKFLRNFRYIVSPPFGGYPGNPVYPH
jgi:hypothetical protein